MKLAEYFSTWLLVTNTSLDSRAGSIKFVVLVVVLEHNSNLLRLILVTDAKNHFRTTFLVALYSSAYIMFR